MICRSMTYAQRAQRMLESRGIVSTPVKAPLALARSGCSYALIVRKHGPEALQIMREAGLLQGKAYRMTDDRWEEL